ncbi:MAG: hypothetical protein OXE92_07960 [Bacteroidetes bacterium]|nr:hypothetical protein [Bacteroidota bacterium]
MIFANSPGSIGFDPLTSLISFGGRHLGLLALFFGGGVRLILIFYATRA